MTTSPVMGQTEHALSHAARLVADARSDFSAQSASLDAQIDAIRGRWGGDGATAFFLLHRQWHEKHRTVVAALDRLASSLVATERDNMHTDGQVGSTMHRLVGRLGAVPGVPA